MLTPRSVRRSAVEKDNELIVRSTILQCDEPLYHSLARRFYLEPRVQMEASEWKHLNRLGRQGGGKGTVFISDFVPYDG